MKTTERILLLLKDGGEWTGMEIGHVLGLWFGPPYAVLHKMEADGKVMSKWKNVPRDGLPSKLRRRMYFKPM